MVVRQCQSRRKAVCPPSAVRIPAGKKKVGVIILFSEVEEVNSVKLIPVDLLFDEEGTIAADVVSSSSAVLLPAGLHLQSLRKTHPGALDLLRKHG